MSPLFHDITKHKKTSFPTELSLTRVSAGFMDISKAFISCIELLDIFKSLGIVHKLFSLLKPYLYTIKQQVRISNILSNELVINNGIPQGIVLSPLLYIILSYM